MSARIDQRDSLLASSKLDTFLLLQVWVNTCLENQKTLQIKSNTNKVFDQQKEINNLLFLEELILIIQDEIIIRNIQNFLREKLRIDIQTLEAKLADEQYAKNVQNQNFNQQLQLNQQIQQSLQSQYQKSLAELSALRAKLNEQLYNLNNKINLYQNAIEKLNTRIGDNLNRIVSDYDSQINQGEYRVEGNAININFSDTYKSIIKDANDKFNKNESFDFKELALTRIRKSLYESLGTKLTFLGQKGLDEIEKIAQDEYSRFERFLNRHGNGQALIRDLENRQIALGRLDSLMLQRDNVINLAEHVVTTETQIVNSGYRAIEGNAIDEYVSVMAQANDETTRLAGLISETDDLSEPDNDADFLAMFGDDNDPQPDQPNDNLNNQQEPAAEAQLENPELENPELENPEQQPAPPGGISVADVAGPPGGPQIQNEEEAPAPEPELPPQANEIKPQPAEVKPVSSTLAALSKLGISKEQILEKKEVDKKREEEAKKAEQQQAKDQSQGSSQRKPDAPDQSGPKIGRKF